MADGETALEKTPVEPVKTAPDTPPAKAPETAPLPSVPAPQADGAGSAEAAPPLEEKRKTPWGRYALMAIVPLILIAGGVYYWLTSGKTASTDNAYIQQNRVSITSEVGGKILDVLVSENQQVKKGQILFHIDPSTYQLQLQQATATLANAEVDVQTLGATVDSNAGAIAAAQSAVKYAQQNYDRHAALMARGFNTRANMDTAYNQLMQAKAQLQTAQASAAVDRAKLAAPPEVGGVNPDIAAARAQIATAKLAIGRTTIVAPFDGVVTQTGNLQVGQMAAAGLPMVTLVANGGSWVEANFKETDLKKMVPGLPAKIKIDAYPGVELKGHVASIGAGTGSEFSILPAQNANGNWVKVTQRVPVRIAIDEKSPRQLIAGLSVDVEVDLEAQPRK